MLNLGSSSPRSSGPDPPSQPDSTIPAANAASKSEPLVLATGSTSPYLASPAIPSATPSATPSAIPSVSPHLHHSPVVEQQTTSNHCTALLQESPIPEDCTDQVEGQQVPLVEEAEAEVLHGATTGPEPGRSQQPSGRLLHLAAAVEMQEQVGAVKASGGVLQVPGPLQEPPGQQRGEGPTGSVRHGVMNAAQGSSGGSAVGKGGFVNAARDSLQGSGVQQRGGSAAEPPGERGVVNAAQGRERTEAARRGTRNNLLLSLHRVAVTDLPHFQDLPIEHQNQPVEYVL